MARNSLGLVSFSAKCFQVFIQLVIFTSILFLLACELYTNVPLNHSSFIHSFV